MQQAESDLAAAKILSGANYHSQAVWLAGQAVEKAHKAVLAALGLRYEERHYKQLGHATTDISGLLPKELHAPPDPQVALMVATLQRRALDCRYPAPAQTVGKRAGPLIAPAFLFTISQRDIADAEKLVDWCKERVTRALCAVQSMKP